MGIWIGMKENSKPELLESETAPTKESHPQYDFAHDLLKHMKTRRDISKPWAD